MVAISKIISSSKSKSVDSSLREYMLGVYNFMSFGLAITGVVAVLGARTGISIAIMRSPLGIVVALSPVFISMYMGFSFNRMSSATVKKMFFGYAALMGVSLSTIFVIFRGADIAKALFSTASLFGAMSIYGYTTKKDLTAAASFAFMIVIGLLISSLVNMFLRSGAFDYLISFASVCVFTFLTAYDVQKIKQVYYSFGKMDSETSKKIAIFGAMQLYVDFIAIFVHLLRLIGSRKD